MNDAQSKFSLSFYQSHHTLINFCHGKRQCYEYKVRGKRVNSVCVCYMLGSIEQIQYICFLQREMICPQYFHNIFTTNSKWQVVIDCYC